MSPVQSERSNNLLGNTTRFPSRNSNVSRHSIPVGQQSPLFDSKKASQAILDNRNDLRKGKLRLLSLSQESQTLPLYNQQQPMPSRTTATAQRIGPSGQYPRQVEISKLSMTQLMQLNLNMQINRIIYDSIQEILNTFNIDNFLGAKNNQYITRQQLQELLLNTAYNRPYVITQSSAQERVWDAIDQSLKKQIAKKYKEKMAEFYNTNMAARVHFKNPPLNLSDLTPSERRNFENFARTQQFTVVGERGPVILQEAQVLDRRPQSNASNISEGEWPMRSVRSSSRSSRTLSEGEVLLSSRQIYEEEQGKQRSPRGDQQVLTIGNNPDGSDNEEIVIPGAIRRDLISRNNSIRSSVDNGEENSRFKNRIAARNIVSPLKLNNSFSSRKSFNLNDSSKNKNSSNSSSFSAQKVFTPGVYDETLQQPMNQRDQKNNPMITSNRIQSASSVGSSASKVKDKRPTELAIENYQEKGDFNQRLMDLHPNITHEENKDSQIINWFNTSPAPSIGVENQQITSRDAVDSPAPSTINDDQGSVRDDNGGREFDDGIDDAVKFGDEDMEIAGYMEEYGIGDNESDILLKNTDSLAKSSNIYHANRAQANSPAPSSISTMINDNQRPHSVSSTSSADNGRNSQNIVRPDSASRAPSPRPPSTHSERLQSGRSAKNDNSRPGSSLNQSLSPVQ